MDALLQLELPDAEVEGDGAFEALVAVNHRWLGRYARLHPSFSVELALLERNSLWMNAFFQKSRMTTSAASPQAKDLVKKHRETIVERLRSAPLPHSESPFSTCVVDPMAALMFAASVDRCPHNNLVREDLLAEAWELLQCASIRTHALRSGFASCIFRFLTGFTETQKRIPCLRLLVLLAEENSSAVESPNAKPASSTLFTNNDDIHAVPGSTFSLLLNYEASIDTSTDFSKPTQKLKMVTKAAVRLHSKGELQRAIELYLLALSSETNDEVSFRLRINLACAYEAAEDLQSSIDEFSLALELNPNDLYANYKLGCVLTLVGAFDEARMRFESILNEYPLAADGLSNLEKSIEAHKQGEETIIFRH
uniref:Uncharacterized protein n=1 Tax=Phytophthora ramorum TaxID=164328 RepID=H3HDQ8_PHYRM